jgi:hypothetical protein
MGYSPLAERVRLEMGDVMSVDTQALAESVELIYEAALRPELWRSVLNRVTGALGSDSAGIFAHPDPSLQCTVWSEGNEVVDWFLREGWHLHSPPGLGDGAAATGQPANSSRE